MAVSVCSELVIMAYTPVLSLFRCFVTSATHEPDKAICTPRSRPLAAGRRTFPPSNTSLSDDPRTFPPPCFFAYSDISPIPFNDEQGVWETSGGKCQGGMSYMYTLASTWSFDTTTLIPRLRNRANIELAQAGLLAPRPWLKCRPRHRLLKSISTTALLCIARRCI